MYSCRQANVGGNARLVLGAKQTPWMQLGRPAEHYLRKRRFFALHTTNVARVYSATRVAIRVAN